MYDVFLTGVTVALIAIGASLLALESGFFDSESRATLDSKQRARQRTVRFTVWGAVLAAVITTTVALAIAGRRTRDPAWVSDPSSEKARSIGLWFGLPVGALAGALAGFAFSRRSGGTP